MVVRAEWLISEAGLQSLASAGIGLAWLRAWLLAAGAADVSMTMLESGEWRQGQADWQLFYADEAELERLALPEGECFELQNPPRSCRYLRAEAGKQMLLLPLGDIAYQRRLYLSRLNPKPSLPLYVLAGDGGDIKLEPGLSASLSRSAKAVLNDEGLLIEEQVASALRSRELGFRSVESCTGGAIAARLARLPGVSDVLDRAWVSYSNQAKNEEMGVSEELLESFGAVSEPVVRAMAEGGCDGRNACIAVSGIAGPDGGTIDKPVGTAWLAVAVPGLETRVQCCRFTGSRSDIQAKTVVAALALLLEMVA